MPPGTQAACGYMQALFKRLEDTGQLQEQTIEQLYSEAAGKFLADRFVTGTCPKCGYEVGATPLHCASLSGLQSLSAGSLSCSSNGCLLPASICPFQSVIGCFLGVPAALLLGAHWIVGRHVQWPLILTCLECCKDEHDSCGTLFAACAALTMPCPQASTQILAGRLEDKCKRACA